MRLGKNVCFCSEEGKTCSQFHPLLRERKWRGKKPVEMKPLGRRDRFNVNCAEGKSIWMQDLLEETQFPKCFTTAQAYIHDIKNEIGEIWNLENNV